MDRPELIAEALRLIARAARLDMELSMADFTVYGGELFLDGMDPDEWIDAMVME